MWDEICRRPPPFRGPWQARERTPLGVKTRFFGHAANGVKFRPALLKTGGLTGPSSQTSQAVPCLAHWRGGSWNRGKKFFQLLVSPVASFAGHQNWSRPSVRILGGLPKRGIAVGKPSRKFAEKEKAPAFERSWLGRGFASRNNKHRRGRQTQPTVTGPMSAQQFGRSSKLKLPSEKKRFLFEETTSNMGWPQGKALEQRAINGFAPPRKVAGHSR